MSERDRRTGESHVPPESRGELPDFRRAVRFADKISAGDAYWRAHELLFNGPTPSDLSIYRLIFDDNWHVAVLGDTPEKTLFDGIERSIATGEPEELPHYLWEALADRRRDATGRGPWTEGHYGPGRRG